MRQTISPGGLHRFGGGERSALAGAHGVVVIESSRCAGVDTVDGGRLVLAESAGNRLWLIDEDDAAAIEPLAAGAARERALALAATIA